MLYRSDDLVGFNVDTSTKEGRDRLNELKTNANYTESYSEALANSTQVGGVNYTGGGETTDSTPIKEEDLSPYSREQAKVLLPYITKLDPVRGEKLIDSYTQGFIDTGKPEFALANMRSTVEYSEMFEGIKRPDGSLRMTEAQYLQNKEAVAIHLQEYNLGGYAKENLDVIFPKLLANNVSPDELRNRVKAVSDTITSLPEEQKAQVLGQYSQYYSDELGENVEVTESALVAIAIDPEVNAQILSKRLNVSQISATFERVTGEDIDYNAVQRLVSGGMTAQRAASEFETATARAMTASRLARRFRKEADFTALEFAEMGAAPDTEFSQQISALAGQAESASSVQIGAKKTQEGAVTGLTEA
jgi:hypothetical protein